MTFPMENRGQGSERVGGVPRLFAVPFRLGLVNAPPSEDDWCSVASMPGEILRAQMYPTEPKFVHARRSVTLG